MRKLFGPPILAFLILCAAGQSQAATVHVTFGSPVSFDLPKGWTACDADTRAQIGGVTPAGGMKKLCESFDDKGGARMAGRADGSLGLSFASLSSLNLPPDFMQGLTPEQVSASSKTICASTFHVPDTAPCTFELSKVDGNTALVGHLNTPDGQFEMSRVITVKTDTDSMIFIFAAFVPNDGTTADINAIAASIHFRAPAH